MQKLCRDQSSHVHKFHCRTCKVPPSADAAGLFLSYIYDCSHAKTPSSDLHHLRDAGKQQPMDQPTELENHTGCFPARDSAGSLPTVFTGPRRITEDKLQVNTAIKQPPSIKSSAEFGMNQLRYARPGSENLSTRDPLNSVHCPFK